MTSATALTQSVAESALQPLLDSYAKRKRTAAQLTAELVAICTQQPAATWQALSLLDRYHRREELSTALFRDLKKELNAIAFGSGRSALSAPGPEADRTSGFMSLFGTRRSNRTSTFAHTRATERTAAGHTAQFDVSPRTAQIDTAAIQRDGQNTAHLQVRGHSTDQIDTAYLQDNGQNTAHVQARGDKPDQIDTIYLQDDDEQNTAHLQAPKERTERLRTASDVTMQPPPPSESAARLPTAQDRTAHLQTQRDSTVRLHAPASSASNEPEPRTNWLDGQRPDALQEADTDYFSSTELRQSHGMARPTGTVVQQPLREVTLTRDQRARQSYAEPALQTQAEFEQSTIQREALTQATLAKSPSLRPGVTLNERYVLVEPISTGGVGVVFKAFDQQRSALPESQRYVAIKCVHESLRNDPRAAAALQHEYRQSLVLSHPNIAKVYDFHQADGMSFLALELIDGESLGRICERIAPRRLPPSRALTIVREIGHAIAHAHERGILHGNLHPNNVTVTRSGMVRVSEFGQATAWLENIAITDDVVRDMPPSPPEQRYRSPQQKNSVPTNAADDIYSLACIAFELLCGRTPDAQAHRAGARKPGYAGHLSQQRWVALQRGLAEGRAQRGNDVRQWLVELDLSSAAIRLPSLADLETELFGGDQNILTKPWVLASMAIITLSVTAGIGWLWSNRAPSEPPEPISIATQAVPPGDPSPQPAAPTPVEAVQPSGSVAQLSSDSAPGDDKVASSGSEASSAGLPIVSFSQSRYEIPPEASVATMSIRRQGSTAKRLVLQWFSIEGSAKSDVDYVRDGNTTIVLQPGQRVADIVVPLIKGEPRDRALWFDVRIRATTDALPGDAVVATVYLSPALTNPKAP